MRLGICYMVFDGDELLEFAIKSIRNVVDFVSVTYQKVSYFGNSVDPNLLPLLENLKKQGLIDEILHYETNLGIHHKQNELNLRNLGLEASKKAGCTHHISADVDEFYKPDELTFAKNYMAKNDHDFSAAYLYTYYKEPTYLVYPVQKLLVSFIHPVHNEYRMDMEYPTFPLHMETTRRFGKCKNYHIFDQNNFVIHHMSYVRKDIRKKFQNSDNAQFYKIEKFINNFDKYKLGERVCLLPDFMNRKTIEVDNYFNIKI